MLLESTQTRLYAATLAAAVAVAAPVAWLAHAGAQRQAMEQGRLAASHLVSAAEGPLAMALEARDTRLQQLLLQGLVQQPTLLKAQLLDARGQVIAEAGKPGVPGPSTADPALAQRPLSSPVAGAAPLGRLVVHAHQRALLSQARQAADPLAGWIVGGVLGLALLAAALGSRLLVRPARQLARQVKGLEKQLEKEPGADRDIRVSLGKAHLNDEFGTVARAVNRLLESISEAGRRERRLQQDAEAVALQYRRIFGLSSTGHCVLDGQGRLVNCNPTLMRQLGATDADVRRWRDAGFLERAFADPARVRAMLEEAREHQLPAAAELELEGGRGANRWAHAFITPLEPNADTARATYECVLVDITALKSARDLAAQRAGQDPLTGLTSREAASDQLDACLERAAAAGKEVCIARIALHGFSAVNDRYGKAAGDHVLRECGLRIRAMTRSHSDIVARLDQDELMLVLDGLSASAPRAQRMAREILSRLSEPILLRDGRMGEVGASVGMASFPANGQEREPLLAAAGRATQSARQTGRNTVHVAEAEPA